jgi:uncharacterized protein YndB with AHSA1/START domain
MTTTDQPLGEARRDATGWVVRFERELAHDREKVWRALTESEHLAHWMPCDIVGERRAGAAIELPFWPPFVEKYGIDTPTLRGEIRVWDPPSVFEWTWDTDVLRWELAERDGGTTLTFTTWLAPDEAGAVNTAAGYHSCLDCLQSMLDDGAPSEPLIEAKPEALERRYRVALAAAR